MPALAREECGPPIRPCMLGNATGDRRDARSSCIVLRDPHCAVDTTQTVRVLPDQQQRAAIFRAPLRTSILKALPARLSTRATVIASPVLFALYASRFPHQISAPLFL